ncbi:hypothetical protein DFH05DRAFT_885050 [Lentinula detonsa]|uniref:Secreted protein n=1 Tax=Lentinula detonsa TaxID=2804962 RepID=A0A9W8U119_9AGAR|nr:hypothetical protein DFH05DRAFT_885050 [Lentinula detonsa]
MWRYKYCLVFEILISLSASSSDSEQLKRRLCYSSSFLPWDQRTVAEQRLLASFKVTVCERVKVTEAKASLNCLPV